MDYYDIEQLSEDDFSYLVDIYECYLDGVTTREAAFYVIEAFGIDFDTFGNYYHAFVE